MSEDTVDEQGRAPGDQPPQATDAAAPEEQTAETAPVVSGSGRIVADVGPLGDGALTRVRQR